jgi:enoyl-CoA hydratase/carnithine racemase
MSVGGAECRCQAERVRRIQLSHVGGQDFTGDQIVAEEAVRTGLVNRAVPPQQLMVEARQLAERIGRQGLIAVARAKDALNQAVQTGQDAGLKHERDAFMATFGTQDRAEGMKAFLERRKPSFKGKQLDVRLPRHAGTRGNAGF